MYIIFVRFQECLLYVNIHREIDDISAAEIVQCYHIGRFTPRSTQPIRYFGIYVQCALFGCLQLAGILEMQKKILYYFKKGLVYFFCSLLIVTNDCSMLLMALNVQPSSCTGDDFFLLNSRRM